MGIFKICLLLISIYPCNLIILSLIILRVPFIVFCYSVFGDTEYLISSINGPFLMVVFILVVDLFNYKQRWSILCESYMSYIGKVLPYFISQVFNSSRFFLYSSVAHRFHLLQIFRIFFLQYVFFAWTSTGFCFYIFFWSPTQNTF